MLSPRLARRLGVHLTEVDEFQIALEAATDPEALPLLHFWHTHFDEYISWTDERRVEHHIRVCREVFDPVIADHLETGTRVVFERDFLLPEMATLATYGQEPNTGRVRALFVSEPDEGQIAANYCAVRAAPSHNGFAPAGCSTRSCEMNATATALRSSIPARGAALSSEHTSVADERAARLCSAEPPGRRAAGTLLADHCALDGRRPPADRRLDIRRLRR